MKLHQVQAGITMLLQPVPLLWKTAQSWILARADGELSEHGTKGETLMCGRVQGSGRKQRGEMLPSPLWEPRGIS